MLTVCVFIVLIVLFDVSFGDLRLLCMCLRFVILMLFCLACDSWLSALLFVFSRLLVVFVLFVILLVF